MRVKAAVGFAADAAAFITGGKEVEFLSFETWASNTSGGGAHSIPMPAAGMLGAAGEVEAFSTCGLSQMSAAVCRVKKSEAAVQYLQRE